MCAWPWPWPITCTSSSVDGSSIRGARRSCKPSERSCRNTWASGSELRRVMAVVDDAEPLQLIDLPEPTAATREALRFTPGGCDEAGNVILTVVNISENQWNN